MVAVQQRAGPWLGAQQPRICPGDSRVEARTWRCVVSLLRQRLSSEILVDSLVFPFSVVLASS